MASQLQFDLYGTTHLIGFVVNVFLQFFDELATDVKPDVDEVAVKGTQGKQVIFSLKVSL